MAAGASAQFRSRDSARAAHRTVLRLRPYNLRPYFYKISRDPYRKVIFKKPDGTVRVKKRVYGRIYGFLPSILRPSIRKSGGSTVRVFYPYNRTVQTVIYGYGAQP